MRCAIWFLIVLVLPVQAAVYRWEDAAGKTHYGEKAPVGAVNVRKISINSASEPKKRTVRAAKKPTSSAEPGNASTAKSKTKKGKAVVVVGADVDDQRTAERCRRAVARRKTVSEARMLTRRSRTGARMVLSHREEEHARLQARLAVRRWCR